MSVHIENVKKALEFKKPDYLPMETNHIPGIYNAYHTLDLETVKFIPGTENFDAMVSAKAFNKYRKNAPVF
ncbi:MAG: hypothetical protein ACYCXB_09710 [Candidatus Humimicrobiaceae bacterium]